MLRIYFGLVLLFMLLTIFSNVVESGESGVAVTKLTTSITRTDSAIPVITTSGFPDSGLLVIGSEYILYSARTIDTFTVSTRGFNRTSPGAYDSGEEVLTEAASIVKDTIGYKIATIQDASVFGFTGPIPAVIQLTKAIVTSFPKMIAWDYSFMYGEFFLYLKILLLWPLSALATLGWILVLLSR